MLNRFFFTVLLLCSISFTFRRSQLPQEYVFDEQLFQNSVEVFQDSLGTVYLSYDSLARPDFYYQKIFTPICESSKCYPVNVVMIWDLMGKFQSYKVYEYAPLTKHEHEPFREEDYHQLYNILRNEHSTFGQYEKHELVEISKKGESKADGASGATVKSVSGETIPGAVYSCYTLWHLANGSIKEVLLNNTRNLIFNENSLFHFLNSSNESYVIFAFEQVKNDFLIKHQDEFISQISKRESYTGVQLAKSLDRELIQNSSFVQKLWKAAQESSYHVKKALIEKIQLNPQLPASLIDELISFSEQSNEEIYVLCLGILLRQKELSDVQLDQTIRQFGEKDRFDQENIIKDLKKDESLKGSKLYFKLLSI